MGYLQPNFHCECRRCGLEVSLFRGLECLWVDRVSDRGLTCSLECQLDPARRRPDRVQERQSHGHSEHRQQIRMCMRRYEMSSHALLKPRLGMISRCILKQNYKVGTWQGYTRWIKRKKVILHYNLQSYHVKIEPTLAFIRP